MAFAHKYQCFNFPMCQVIFRPFKVMAMTPMHLANFAYKNLYFFIRCIGQFGLKKASGHRPCPIAYNVFKMFKAFKNYKI